MDFEIVVNVFVYRTHSNRCIQINQDEVPGPAMSEQSDENASLGVPVDENPENLSPGLTKVQELNLAESLIASDRLLSQHIQDEVKKDAEESAKGGIDYASITLFVTALLSSAVVLVSLAILGYLVVTYAFAPRRLEYSMPLPLDLVEHDLVANISLHSLQRYVDDGQARDVFLLEQLGEVDNQRPLISAVQKFDVWLKLYVPPEFEKKNPERRFAHVTSSLSTATGTVTSRISKPVYLNGRRASVLGIVLWPWRFAGVLPWDHAVTLNLFSGVREPKALRSVFLATQIKARSPPGPEILEATIGVRLRAGVVQTVLYYARPQSLLGKLLAVGSSVAVLAGAGVVVGCYQAYRNTKRADTGEDIGDGMSDDGDLLLRGNSDEDLPSAAPSPIRMDSVASAGTELDDEGAVQAVLRRRRVD